MQKDELSRRQTRFVVALLGGATVAAAAAAAGVTERCGYNYLLADAVKAELRRRQDAALTLATLNLVNLSDEALGLLRDALALLSDHAGADVADFITVAEGGGWALDLAAAETAGKLHLVKKLWSDAQGGDRLELHDAQAAAARLGSLALDILDARRRAGELDDLADRVAVLEQQL